MYSEFEALMSYNASPSPGRQRHRLGVWRSSERGARSAYTPSQSKSGVYDHWLSMAGVSHTGVLAGSPGRCASGDAAPADPTAQWKGAQWLRLALAAVAHAHGQHIENRAA